MHKLVVSDIDTERGLTASCIEAGRDSSDLYVVTLCGDFITFIWAAKETEDLPTCSDCRAALEMVMEKVNGVKQA